MDDNFTIQFTNGSYIKLVPTKTRGLRSTIALDDWCGLEQYEIGVILSIINKENEEKG